MGRSLDHQGIQKRNAKCVGVKAYAFEELYISAIINERSLDRLQQDQQLQHRLARSNSFVLPYSQQKYHGKTKKEYYFVTENLGRILWVHPRMIMS